MAEGKITRGVAVDYARRAIREMFPDRAQEIIDALGMQGGGMPYSIYTARGIGINMYRVGRVYRARNEANAKKKAWELAHMILSAQDDPNVSRYGNMADKVVITLSFPEQLVGRIVSTEPGSMEWEGS